MQRSLVCLWIFISMFLLPIEQLDARGPGGFGGGGGPGGGARGGGLGGGGFGGGGPGGPGGGGFGGAGGRGPSFGGGGGGIGGGGGGMNRPNAGGLGGGMSRPDFGGAGGGNRPGPGGGGGAASGFGGLSGGPGGAGGDRFGDRGSNFNPENFDTGRVNPDRFSPGNANSDNLGLGQGNRPAQRPAGGLDGNAGLGGNRPSASQLDSFLDLPRGGQTGSGAGRFSGDGANRAGGAAADFLNNSDSFGNRGFGNLSDDTRPGSDNSALNRLPNDGQNLPDRAQNWDRGQFAENYPDRIQNDQQWSENRNLRANQINTQVNNYYGNGNLNFWSEYPGWATWGITAPYRWAAWGSVAGTYGYTTPTYYSYGSPQSVYYENNVVYNNGQQVASADEYAQQAQTIAQSAPANTDPSQSEWMSLGVFALTQDGQPSGPAPTLFLQLAVNKEGVISGLLNNKATDDTLTIQGAIDKKTQRAAWCVKDHQWPIMETGLANLTQDQTSALVHFENGQTQQWLMVHVKEPASGQQSPR